MGSSRRPARPHETGDKLDRLAHTSTQISTEPWNRRWAPPKPPYAMMPGLRDRYFSRQVRALAIGSVPSSVLRSSSNHGSEHRKALSTSLRRPPSRPTLESDRRLASFVH